MSKEHLRISQFIYIHCDGFSSKRVKNNNVLRLTFVFMHVHAKFFCNSEIFFNSPVSNTSEELLVMQCWIILILKLDNIINTICHIIYHDWEGLDVVLQFQQPLVVVVEL